MKGIHIMNNSIILQTRNSSDYSGYKIDRKLFRCLELNIPTSGEWMHKIMEKAAEIEGKLNVGQANSSEARGALTIKIDNLSGVIAEYACAEILRLYVGKDKIIKPSSESSKNQIDIALAQGKKTIEVRSSCVKNGIDFALFAKPAYGGQKQYFDVIGPYSNQYKPGECEKDYYMRVLYCCEKKNFMDLLGQATLKMYITGGATKDMMNNNSIYQIKHLVPDGGEVDIESDYRVVPLGNSLDVVDFIEKIKMEI